MIRVDLCSQGDAVRMEMVCTLWRIWAGWMGEYWAEVVNELGEYWADVYIQAAAGLERSWELV